MLSLNDIKRFLIERLTVSEYNGHDEVIIKNTQIAEIIRAMNNNTWDDETQPLFDSRESNG